MQRREFLGYLGALTSLLAGCRYWPSNGLSNPCLHALPERLLQHPIVLAALENIKLDQLWDCHVHLIGTGDSGSGIWLNPNMQSLFHPIQLTQMKFYLDGACVTDEKDTQSTDVKFVKRLIELQNDFGLGMKIMLLAFDYNYDQKGVRQPQLSAFYTPNEYAANIAQQYSQQFEWIASVHPYRKDAIAAITRAKANGARACKWLPGAMGIDPASPQCDEFYTKLVKLDMPLLSHTGAEQAVDAPYGQEYGNPLLLRRALDKGVKVICAHCATIGENQDLDEGPDGAMVSSLSLFARLMDDPNYRGKVFGDIAALTQVNRDKESIITILQRQDWHDRLVYGSDYPLPGVIPAFSTENLVSWGLLSEQDAPVLNEIRQYNPLFFDFVLKRRISYEGQTLSPNIFHSKRFFV